MLRRFWVLAFFVGLSLTAFGCSRGGPKDQNKDKDRPKPAEKA